MCPCLLRPAPGPALPGVAAGYGCLAGAPTRGTLARPGVWGRTADRPVMAAERWTLGGDCFPGLQPRQRRGHRPAANAPAGTCRRADSLCDRELQRRPAAVRCPDL